MKWSRQWTKSTSLKLWPLGEWNVSSDSNVRSQYNVIGKSQIRGIKKYFHLQCLLFTYEISIQFILDQTYFCCKTFWVSIVYTYTPRPPPRDGGWEMVVVVGDIHIFAFLMSDLSMVPAPHPPIKALTSHEELRLWIWESAPSPPLHGKVNLLWRT